MWLLCIQIQHLSDCGLMHYGWRPLLLTQILPLSQPKPLFRDTKEENEKGGSGVTEAHLNFISTQMCICNPRQSSRTAPGDEGGVFWDHTWGLAGIRPGTCRGHSRGHRMSELWPCCAQGASFLRWQCTFSVPWCAPQLMCALAVFSRLFFRSFPDCFFTFFSLPQLFSRIPASFGFLCTVLLF